MMSMLNNQMVMVFVLIILISVNFLAGYLTLVMCSVVLSGAQWSARYWITYCFVCSKEGSALQNDWCTAGSWWWNLLFSLVWRICAMFETWFVFPCIPITNGERTVGHQSHWIDEHPPKLNVFWPWQIPCEARMYIPDLSIFDESWVTLL